MLDKLSLGVAVAAAVALAAKLVLTAGVTDLQKEVAARQQTLAASQVLGHGEPACGTRFTAHVRHASTGPALMPGEDHGASRSIAVIALLIGLLTLLADQVAGIVRLSATREELTEARAQQEAPLEQARRIEKQLDALASGTAELAAQGNPNAAAIVATLQAQGVSIKTPAAAAQ